MPMVRDGDGQAGVENARVGRPRRPGHGVRLGRLHRKRQRGGTVCHQVDPKDLQGEQGQGEPQGERGDHDCQLCGVAGQQIAQELPDVVIDHPPFLDRSHYGGEIVVQEDHLGRLLGHVRAGDPHGHPDVGAAQGGSVVDPVPGHGHHVSAPLQSGDDRELVLRGHAGEHPGALCPVRQLLLVQLRDGAAAHHLGVFAGDRQIDGDPPRRQG